VIRMVQKKRPHHAAFPCKHSINKKQKPNSIAKSSNSTTTTTTTIIRLKEEEFNHTKQNALTYRATTSKSRTPLYKDITLHIFTFLPSSHLLKCRLLSKTIHAWIHANKQVWNILGRPPVIMVGQVPGYQRVFVWLYYMILYCIYDVTLPQTTRSALYQVYTSNRQRQIELNNLDCCGLDGSGVLAGKERVLYRFISDAFALLPRGLFTDLHVQKQNQKSTPTFTLINNVNLETINNILYYEYAQDKYPLLMHYKPSGDDEDGLLNTISLDEENDNEEAYCGEEEEYYKKEAKECSKGEKVKETAIREHTTAIQQSDITTRRNDDDTIHNKSLWNKKTRLRDHVTLVYVIRDKSDHFAWLQCYKNLHTVCFRDEQIGQLNIKHVHLENMAHVTLEYIATDNHFYRHVLIDKHMSSEERQTLKKNMIIKWNHYITRIRCTNDESKWKQWGEDLVVEFLYDYPNLKVSLCYEDILEAIQLTSQGNQYTLYMTSSMREMLPYNYVDTRHAFARYNHNKHEFESL
jgi:hypothetical protein